MNGDAGGLKILSPKNQEQKELKNKIKHQISPKIIVDLFPYIADFYYIYVLKSL